MGRVWERKFLGFSLNRALRIEVAAPSLSRLKQRVRQMWDARQSRTSKQLRDRWRRYVRGWWGYFSLAEERQPIWRLEGWGRRHIRKCFWLRAGARPARPATRIAQTRNERPPAARRRLPSRRVADCGQPHLAHRTVQRRAAQVGIPDAVRPCGSRLSRRVQPLDTENRTSSGVGGCRGAIPGTRPDPDPDSTPWSWVGAVREPPVLACATQCA